VQNFLASLKGTPGLSGGKGQGQGQAQGKAYPLLNDLLETSVTIPVLEAASEEYVDNLLSYLPPAVLVLAQQGDNADFVDAEPSAEAITAARNTMTLDQKRTLLKKVLRSPQLNQSLASLTMAIRDGGLPSISEALGIAVENGGRVQGGTMPLGGGDAVEAFVEGVKKTVQK
jgi:26S proteasome regulatory subunit N13